MKKGDEIITREAKHFRIGEFADRSGVTLRTLRYYDKLGLLKPSARSESGQRLYGELDYARLQQILTLKLIGLSLEEIKSLLTSEVSGIQDLLERQKRVLQEQAKQLERVIQTIEKAQRSMDSSQRLDLEQFVEIIKVVNMNAQSNWVDRFMTGEQQEKLADLGRSLTLAEQKEIGGAWKRLFSDVQSSMDKDVSSPEVQGLVDRLDSLMAQLTERDSDFATNLTRAYTQIDTLPDIADAPPEVREWIHNLREAAIFMQKARAARES